MVHRIINNRAPVYFKSYFSQVKLRHGHFTRQSIIDLNLCKFRTLYVQRAFVYFGAQEWNNLPLDIKVMTVHEGFSKRLKIMFLDGLSLNLTH